jgi:hypothetical protein
MYNRLMENEVKQPCFINLQPWFGFLQWSPNHTHMHTYNTSYMIIKKHNLFVWNATLTSNNKGIEYDIYEIWPRWCLIVTFFIFFCVGTFFKMFHSTRVCKSSCSCSKNSWTHACSYIQIQWRSCLSLHVIHPSSTLSPHLKLVIL